MWGRARYYSEVQGSVMKGSSGPCSLVHCNLADQQDVWVDLDITDFTTVDVLFNYIIDIVPFITKIRIEHTGQLDVDNLLGYLFYSFTG